MTDERRYGEEEIREIFEIAEKARERGARAVPSAGGLTLTELQAIGREVGVPPERIAEAASSLELRRGAAPRQRFLGVPISAGLTVDLPRAPTKREWELLVADLREVFDAQGRDRSAGNLRGWTNGNLRVNVEPTPDGYRLRMITLKGEAVAINRISIAVLLMGIVLLVTALFGNDAGDLRAALILGAMAAAGFGYNALRLPAWAGEREQQFELIASRARTLLSGESDAEDDSAAISRNETR